MKDKVFVYDTTLRDGSQAEGVNFSIDDKLRIIEKLDEFGIHYLECGWPGSNPKDTALFEKLKNIKLKNSKVVAFGSTKRPNKKPHEDKQLENLLRSGSRVITIFGKSWDFHVTQAMSITLEENLNMVYQTVQYLKKHVDEVIFDAEHFFDGYKSNPNYALEVLNAALQGGSDWIVLCDTNGGSLPHEVYNITKAVKEKFLQANIGIHTHNDSDNAVANSLMAVLAGARQVHGTINGIGERTGNANLCSIIPNLQIKMGFDVIFPESIKRLTEIANFVSELSNIPLPKNIPYVGESAFAHKAGIHASAIMRETKTYEHVDPFLVGNKRKVVISDLSGRSNLLYKLRELDMEVNESELIRLLEKIKELEKEGYHFEAAEASFELLCKRHFGLVKNYFELDAYRVLIARRSSDEFPVSEATVRLYVNGVREHTAALGNGPVNALDRAIRKALETFYPNLREVQLIDYKVRIVNESEGTLAKVRVLIESTDGKRRWGTVGVSENIIEASWIALTDGLIYKLLKDEEENRKS
ncbi:MAG: citramalate synthase [Aquificaceae bacterium]